MHGLDVIVKRNAAAAGREAAEAVNRDDYETAERIMDASYEDPTYAQGRDALHAAYFEERDRARVKA